MRKAIYLIIFCFPFYLVRFSFGLISTNLVEMLIGVALAVWLILGKKEKNSLKLEDKWLWLAIFLMLVGLTISTAFSADLRMSVGIWKSWFFIPLIFFFLLVKIVKREEIKDILTALTLSGAVVSLIALGYWLLGRLTYDGRLAAFYSSPNYLAMYLAPILVLSFYLKRNILRTAAQCLMLLVVYLTYSYGALLSIFAALFFWAAVKKKKRLLGLLVLLILLLVALQFPTRKFQGYLSQTYPSLKSRLVIWRTAWEIIKDRFLIGIGPGMFQKYYLDYQVFFPPYPEWAVPQPHNIFLAFWLQTGLLGLIGFLWLLAIFFRKNFSTIFAAALVCLLVHGLVDTTYWKNDLALIFWLIIGLNCIANRLSGSQKLNNLSSR